MTSSVALPTAAFLITYYTSATMTSMSLTQMLERIEALELENGELRKQIKALKAENAELRANHQASEHIKTSFVRQMAFDNKVVRKYTMKLNVL